MISIDTGARDVVFAARSAAAEDGQRIKIVTPARAKSEQKKILANIEAHECADRLKGYWEREELILDALHLFDPAAAADLADAFETHRAVLQHGGAHRDPAPMPVRGAPAHAITKTEGTRKMFAIDTGNDGGSQGPWFTWTSEGSARKGLPPESWKLRHKADGDTEWTEDAIPAFSRGCIMDLDSLKLGWEKDGGKGVAPERRWNPSISQATPRPSEEKKPGGGFVWGKALSVRCAIERGKAATWEQASFGAYEAFTRLARQIQAEYPGDGTLPLVRQAGVERRDLNSGSTSIPILEVVKWVARPDSLKADAPQIQTEAPMPAPAPPPKAAPAAAVPEDAEF